MNCVVPVSSERDFLFYRTLFEATLKSAEQYLKDAKLLVKHGSYGHAYSLTVLGFEEWSKSMLAVGLFLGFVEKDDELVSDFKTNHISKQLEGIRLLFTIVEEAWLEAPQTRDEVIQLKMSTLRGEISYKSFERKYRRLLEKDPSPVAQTLRDLLEQLDKIDVRYIEEKKQRGFYVDFDLEKRIYETPEQFILSDIEFINTLEFLVGYAKEFYPLLRSQKKSVKKHIQSIRKNVKEWRLFFLKSQVEEQD